MRSTCQIYYISCVLIPPGHINQGTWALHGLKMDANDSIYLFSKYITGQNFDTSCKLWTSYWLWDLSGLFSIVLVSQFIRSGVSFSAVKFHNFSSFLISLLFHGSGTIPAGFCFQLRFSFFPSLFVIFHALYCTNLFHEESVTLGWISNFCTNPTFMVLLTLEDDPTEVHSSNFQNGLRLSLWPQLLSFKTHNLKR